MEQLGRGVVALHSGHLAGLRELAFVCDRSERHRFQRLSFRQRRRGCKKLNSTVITNTTDYLDTTANFTVSNALGMSSQYSIASSRLPARRMVSRPIPRAPVCFASTGEPRPVWAYDVKFCWFGDFDGDGEYDYLMDRMSDTTGGVNQFLRAYKRDGTFLWQMDMGFNSTNTANAYEPDAAAISIGDKDNVTVYDLDGDGKAEVIVRTANGTIFADSSQVVTNNNTVRFLHP